MTTTATPDRTEVGNYFVATYPPFSVWTQDAVTARAVSAPAGQPIDSRALMPSHPERRFEDEIAGLGVEGVLDVGEDRLALTRDGLLRVDSLLPRFFRPEHRAVRYT
jgi:hypothetical protein